jgi:hypothetical protein
LLSLTKLILQAGYLYEFCSRDNTASILRRHEIVSTAVA